MTTDIPAVLVGSSYRPGSTPPREFAEAWFDGTTFRYNTPEDYWSEPASSPKSTITEVFEGSIKPPAHFAGVHYSNIALWSSPPMKAQIIRLHDATYNTVGPSGRTRWSKVNTADGVYDWTALDAVVDYWYSRGFDMIYTLSPTPTWASARPAEAASYELGSAAEPASNTYWTNWCQAVASRYNGKIRYWEVWNEVNLTGFYTGTKAKLAELARLAHTTIKSVNATNVILSPNVTSLATGGATYFDGYLTASDGAAGTGKDWFDIVACHLYCSASTRMGLDTDGLVAALKAVLTTRSVTKPIWNTECGLLAPDANALPADKMKHVKRSMLIAAALGVEHWSYYTFDHGTMGVHDRAQYANEWNLWLTQVGGTITRVNRLWDGRLAAVIDGNRYLI